MSDCGRNVEKLKSRKSAEDLQASKKSKSIKENGGVRPHRTRPDSVKLLLRALAWSMVVYHASSSSSREKRMWVPPNLGGHAMQFSKNSASRILRILLLLEAPCFCLICLTFRSGL